MNESPSQSQGRPAFFWIVLLLGATLLGFYIFATTAAVRYGTRNKDFGWRAVTKGSSYYIVEVDPQGMAAGKLLPGDRILAINDDERMQQAVPWWGPIREKLRAITPGSNYTVRVVRGQTVEHYELTLPPLRHNWRKLIYVLPLFVVSIAYFAIGLLIGLLRAEKRITRLFSLSSFGFAVMLLATSFETMLTTLQDRDLVPFMLLYSALPLEIAVTYHFYYRFPPGAPEGRFWSALNYLFYAWGAFLVVGFTLFRAIIMKGGDAAIDTLVRHAGFIRMLFDQRNAYMTVVGIAIFAVMTRNYRLLKEPHQRRRIKLVVYGTAVGILPPFFFALDSVLFGSVNTHIYVSSFFVYFAVHMMIVIIPITLAYAIVKHRVFAINLVIRRGLQYLLARNVLMTIVWLPVLGLGLAIYENRNSTVQAIFFENKGYAFLALAAALSLRYRQQLSHWIDRRFFREVYNQEKILIELIEEIKKLDSMTEISKLVSERLASALHPKRIYVYYIDETSGNLRLNHTSSNLPVADTIGAGWQLLRVMSDQEQAVDYPLPGVALPGEEQTALEELRVTMIVPMQGSDSRLAGLLLLGEKRSEEPYTAADRKLLKTIAGEMAMVYENAVLKGLIHKEQKIKQEVLARFEDQHINLVKECPICGRCYDSNDERCAQDNCALTLTLPVERVIEGKYRLNLLLGKGGMGAVYKADDLRLGREVAIKVLLGSMFGNQEALRRFEREARASARLNHQNIVTIYDYGRLAAEGAYLAMEYIEGVTLRGQLARRGGMMPLAAAELFQQLLEGVKAAHQAGVIHRDLKPANILIANGDTGKIHVKVLDFGLAKLVMDGVKDGNTITEPGTIMGTFGYMSPEQLAGEEVDERADIFSIGVIVIEALTGLRPNYGRTLTEQIASLAQESRRLESGVAEVAWLDSVLQRCLAAEPADRYSSVVELQRDLVPAIKNCPPLTVLNPDIYEAETMINDSKK